MTLKNCLLKNLVFCFSVNSLYISIMSPLTLFSSSERIYLPNDICCRSYGLSADQKLSIGMPPMCVYIVHELLVSIRRASLAHTRVESLINKRAHDVVGCLPSAAINKLLFDRMPCTTLYRRLFSARLPR